MLAFFPRSNPSDRHPLKSVYTRRNSMRSLLVYPETVLQRAKRSCRSPFDAFWLLSQLSTYPFIGLLMLRWRVQIHRPDSFDVPQGTLILANHQSYYDPFLITYGLGPHNWPRVLPCRYPVAQDVIRDRALALPIRALGGYDIGGSKIERAKKLLYTRELLDRGYTIIIFPEGAITKTGEMISDFKLGAQMLFSRAYPVVFTKLQGFTKTARRERTYSITYSPVLRGSSEELSQRMRDFYRS